MQRPNTKELPTHGFGNACTADCQPKSKGRYGDCNDPQRHCEGGAGHANDGRSHNETHNFFSIICAVANRLQRNAYVLQPHEAHASTQVDITECENSERVDESTRYKTYDN